MNLRINCFYVRKCVLLNSLLYLYITRHLFGLIKCIHNNLFLSPHLLELRILSRLPLLRCPKVVIRLEREQLLTAALPFARFFLHRCESNVTQNDKPFSCHEYRVVCAVSRRPVIAVRVSGGHLCEAEAPTEPAGETRKPRGNPFFP